MTSSLVGSEMCIRDSSTTLSSATPLRTCATPPSVSRADGRGSCGDSKRSVSYTHLTLPTICSV
eukprot:6962482-Prorocentrum_lima.AAC.1